MEFHPRKIELLTHDALDFYRFTQAWISFLFSLEDEGSLFFQNITSDLPDYIT
jgi:hypothetical protein